MVIDYHELASKGLLADEGVLEDRNMGAILYQLWDEQFSGFVRIKSETKILWIFLENGALNSVGINDPDFRLGECLLRHNLITTNDFEKATKEAIRYKKQLGKTLIEIGALAPEDLMDALKIQVIDVISEAINWSSGSYTIYLVENEIANITPLQLETPAILFQASRRLYRWSIIRRTIPSLDLYPHFMANDAWPLVATFLNPEENHLITLCSGRFKISTICEMSYLNSFETMRMLWILRTMELINLSEHRLSSTASGFTHAEDSHEPPDEYKEFMLQDLVQKYNELYQQIIEPIVKEKGGQIDIFIENCLTPIRESMPERMKGVTMSQYGEIDFDVIYRNFSGLDYERTMREMSILLEDIFYALIYHLEDILPPEKAEQIRQNVLKHHRSLT